MRPTRVLLGAAGLGLMAYAVWGILTGPGTDPLHQALFMAALVLGHEGVLMPIALAFGWAAVRLVPAWARPAAQGALVVSLALTVIAIPFIANAGRFPDNTSLLPLDYRLGLLASIALTWLAATLVAVRHWWSQHRGTARRQDPYGGSG